MSDTTETVETSETVETVETSENVETPLTSVLIDNLLKNLDSTLKSVKGYVSEIRSLKKDVQFMEKKIKRLENKKGKRKNKDNTNKSNNGFARPTLISKVLANFLKTELVDILSTVVNDAEGDSPKILEKNEKTRTENDDLKTKVSSLGDSDSNMMARTEVTKLLNKYIKYHNLQDPENKKNILLTSDSGNKLKNLLSDLVDTEGKTIDLTFINIQKYIKHHFPKSTTAKETPVETEEISKEVPSVVEKGTPVKKVVTVKKKAKRPLKKRQVAA